jgi:hypothetical protein
MNITRDNYEQYFLDHAEGNLSREMEKELTDFLEANPDLKAVLEDFDPSPLQTVEIRNEIPKAGLKKHLHLTDHISEENADDWMIRDLEGLLDVADKNELKEFLSLNPPYRFDYKIFGYTKLSPDLSVSYRRKKELKKKVSYFPVRRLVWLLPAAAAMILLFIGIRFFMKPAIQPSHTMTPPIAGLPKLSSYGIAAASTASPEVQNRAPSRVHPAEITRNNTSSIKPISAKSVILLHPTETSSLIQADQRFTPILTIEKKDPSLLAKVFNNMIAQTRESISNRTNLDKARKTDFNIWSIAQAGVNGYNSISDRELELFVHKNEDGKVKSYALVDQKRLILEKELDKN